MAVQLGCSPNEWVNYPTLVDEETGPYTAPVCAPCPGNAVRFDYYRPSRRPLSTCFEPTSTKEMRFAELERLYGESTEAWIEEDSRNRFE